MFLAPCAVGGVARPAVRLARCTTGGSTRQTSRHGRCGSWPGRSTSTPDATRTSPGPSQPVPARHGLRLPGHLPGLLPARRGRSAEDDVAAPDLPRHPRPVRLPCHRRTARRPAVRPRGAPEGLRHGRGRRSTQLRCDHRQRRAASRATWSAWPSEASASACTWPSTSPSSSTCCPTRSPPQRTSASSTSPVPCPSPSRPPWRRPCSPSGSDSYSVLYAVAAACALAAAVAVLPIRRTS